MINVQGDDATTMLYLCSLDSLKIVQIPLSNTITKNLLFCNILENTFIRPKNHITIQGSGILLTDKRFEEREGTTSTSSRVREFEIDTGPLQMTRATPPLAVSM